MELNKGDIVVLSYSNSTYCVFVDYIDYSSQTIVCREQLSNRYREPVLIPINSLTKDNIKIIKM